MRSSVSSWTIKVLLMALILSFISFYGWSAGKGCTAQVAARVNGDNLTFKELDDRFQNFVYQYRNMGLLKDDANPEILNSLRVSVLQGMIGQQLKLQEADRLGLTASEDAVRDVIKKQFADSEGNFDFDTYKKIVTLRLHRTPAIYEQQQADSQIAALYDDLLTASSFSTAEELRKTYQLRNEKVNLEYVELDSAKVEKKLPADQPPTEAAQEKYFKDHQATYKLPEKRKIEIAWVNPADLYTPTDGDLASALDELKKEPAVAGERIRAAHVLLRTAENDVAEKERLANDVYRRVTHGARFEDVAQAESEDSSRVQGGDLGYFGKGQMVKEFEAAALKLKINEISKPVKSQFGFHVIKLLDRIPAGEATAARLKSELAYRFLKKATTDKTTGEKLAAAAQKLMNGIKDQAKKAGNLKTAVTDPKVRYTHTDFVGQGDKIPGVPDDAQMIRLAETVTTGAVSEPVRGSLSGGLYLLMGGEIRPASMPPLASVREKIISDMVTESRSRAVKEYAADLLKGWIDQKKPISVLAKQAGLSANETGNFARTADLRVPMIGPSEKIMNVAFGLTKDQPFVTEPIELKNRFYLIALKNRTDPDWAKFEKEARELRATADQEDGRQRMNAWMEQLRSKSTIKNYYTVNRPKPGSGGEEDL